MEAANKIEKEKKDTQFSSLSMYFAEVDGGKLLTKDEEIELAKSMDAARYRDEKGEKSEEILWDLNVEPEVLRKAKEAREKLISSNLRLVASVAKTFQGKGCDLEDLIQEGNIGLMDGIDKFDWERNFKISTYCTWWIRQRIDRLIANQGRTVRVPVHVHNTVSKLKSFIEEFNKEFDSNPTATEVSEYIGCSLEMAKQALFTVLSPNNVAIDHSPSSTNENDENLHSYIKDENAVDPLTVLSHQELVKEIRAILKTLPERDEKIIRLRFGISEDPTDVKNWPITKEEMATLEKRANDRQ